MGMRVSWSYLFLVLALPGLAAAQSMTPTPMAISVTPTVTAAAPSVEGRMVIPIDDGSSSAYEAQKSDLKTPVKTDEIKQALSALDEKKAVSNESPSVGSLDDSLGDGPELGAPAKGEKVREALSTLNGDQLSEGAVPTATPTPVKPTPTPEL